MLVVLSGCAANRQYFRPTERVRGQTLQGYSEAFYELVGSQSRFGEAKVWSTGAYRHGSDSVVHVTLELHNTSAQPIEVSAGDLRLEPVQTSKQLLRQLSPAETGVFKVQPETQAELNVHFLLPAGMRPGEVKSFRFLWRVKNHAQSYAQSTPFYEEAAFYPPASSAYVYYYPTAPCSPYDPRCISLYYDSPRVWYAPAYLPGPPSPAEERRRVDVKP